jgi:glycosyltransferase involved in cell wall biosynthesis
MSVSMLAGDAREWAVARAKGVYRVGRQILRRDRPESSDPLAVVSLQSGAARPTGRALLSYMTDPFVLPADHPDHLVFSRFGLAKCIAQALLDLGFDVDVISVDEMSFRSNEAYDLAVISGGVNFDALSRNVLGSSRLVYFSTGSHWAFHNEAEVGRFAALRARRGIDLPLDRFIRYSEQRANVLADGIVCTGNQAVRETYSGFPTVITLNTAAFADGFFATLSKDYAAGRRRFLFFVSGGGVHQGLDLVLEAFAGLDAELYVCGAIEPEFRIAFTRELTLPNVHDMGWLPLRSAEFYDLMRTCNYAILPSACEGQPGSIVECMHRGLIPIVSIETHVDTEDFGLTLPECSMDAIRAAVTKLMVRPVGWHEAASRRAYQAAVTEYAPEAFQTRFRGAVQAILDAPGKPRRHSMEPKTLLSTDAEVGIGLPPSSAGSRVAIDAVFFQWNNTGIARVWDSLFKEWSNDEFGSTVIVLDRAGTAPRYPGLTYAPIPAYPAGGDLDSDRDMLEEACHRYEANLFASTYYTYPRQTPSISVVYDMIPESTSMNMKEPVWQRKHQAIRHAAGYLAISASTADDVAKYFPSIAREDVVVAHCAAGGGFTPATSAETQAFRRAYGLPEHYYLFVGSRIDYKNCRLLLDAFAIIDSHGQSALLLVGGAPTIEAEFATLVNGRSVVMAALTDGDLRVAYSAAAALVFPSKYEGFGLPILEAMACGCPVIACANSSIPEVAGDAAIYVDDHDPRQLADAMLLIRDEEIRRRYVRAGVLRSGVFSWARMAETVQREMQRVRECVEVDSMRGHE